MRILSFPNDQGLTVRADAEQASAVLTLKPVAES